MKITHTYTTKKTFDFEVSNGNFLKDFGHFRKVRERIGLPVERYCFYCRKKFKDSDQLKIAFIKGQKNRIIHAEHL